MFLINGENRTELTVSDRGFQYGDGLFETIEVFKGQLLFVEQHYQRLALGCKKLLLPVPDKSLLLYEAHKISREVERGVIKIIITRGSGGRGYRQPDCLQPTRIVSLHPFPDYPAAFQQEGVNTRFCQHRLGHNPALAGIKHLNRLEQILARAEWTNPAIQEGLLFDLEDNLIEGTMSNLFFVQHKTLYTPLLTHAGIAGIMRDFVLHTAQKKGIKTVQGKFTQEQILTADEIFLTNSIIGIWPVKQLEQTSFAVGILTQTMQHALTELKKQVCA